MPDEKNKIEEQSNVILIGKFDQLIIDSKKELHDDTVKDDKKFKELIDFALKLKVENIDSRAIYEQVTTQLKEVKKIKGLVDTRRKQLTAPALKYQKTLKSYGDAYLTELERAEKHLAKEKQKFDDILKAEANRLFSERVGILVENGYKLSGNFYILGPVQIESSTISKMDQKGFDYHVELGKAELERQKAEKERLELAEKERKDQLQELADARAEIAKARAEIAEERAELQKQQSALDATYKEVEKPAEAIDESKKTDEKPSDDSESKEQPIEASKPIEKVVSNSTKKPTTEKVVEVYQDEKHIDTVKVDEQIPKSENDGGDFGDIFENLEISPEQIGFNQCRVKVLEIINDKSITKKAVFITKINDIKYVLEEKK